AIAPAQVFLVGFGVDRFGLGQTGLFVRAQFDAQAVDDAFGDLVLYGDDVVRRGIDPIAPDDLAASDVEQLRGHPEALARVNKSGREHRIDAQLAAHICGIDDLSLVLRHYRRRPDDQRSDPRQLGYYRISESKFVKVRSRIVVQIFEGQHGD